MMDLTTAGLIADIELNALLPDGMYEPSDIISFINDGYFTYVLPFIMRYREDFFVAYADYSPAASIPIPTNAIGQKLKDVQIKKDSNHFFNLPRLSMGEVTSIQNYNRYNGFYIQDNTIVFYPNPQSNDVRLVYFKRPNYLEDSTITTNESLVDSTTVYKITAASSGTTVYVTPSPLAALGAGVTVNFSHSKGYQPFDTVDGISLVTSAVANQFTAPSAAIAASFTEGDYLCNPGYSAFPKITIEMRDLLVQAATIKVMISMKDKDGYKLAMEQLSASEKLIGGLISPRIDNEVKKIVNSSSGIWNRGHKGWRK